MCEQCCAKAIRLGSLGKLGFYEATKDGHTMKKGDFGLVETNDPTFYFSKVPRPEPPEESDDFDPWFDDAMIFAIELLNMANVFDVYQFYNLVDEGIKQGYQKEEHGKFELWLFNYLGKQLDNANSVFLLMKELMQKRKFVKVVWDYELTGFSEKNEPFVQSEYVAGSEIKELFSKLNTALQGMPEFHVSSEELEDLPALRARIFLLAEETTHRIPWIAYDERDDVADESSPSQ